MLLFDRLDAFQALSRNQSSVMPCVSGHIGSEAIGTPELLGEPTNRPGALDVYSRIVDKQQLRSRASEAMSNSLEKAFVRLLDSKVA